MNEMLGFHWTDIELPDAELKQINVSGLHFPDALYNERTVRRIFNNGSFDEGDVSMVVGGNEYLLDIVLT